jgi:hypothetical protein
MCLVMCGILHISMVVQIVDFVPGKTRRGKSTVLAKKRQRSPSPHPGPSSTQRTTARPRTAYSPSPSTVFINPETTETSPKGKSRGNKATKRARLSGRVRFFDDDDDRLTIIGRRKTTT